MTRRFRRCPHHRHTPRHCLRSCFDVLRDALFPVLSSIGRRYPPVRSHRRKRTWRMAVVYVAEQKGWHPVFSSRGQKGGGDALGWSRRLPTPDLQRERRRGRGGCFPVASPKRCGDVGLALPVGIRRLCEAYTARRLVTHRPGDRCFPRFGAVYLRCSGVSSRQALARNLTVVPRAMRVALAPDRRVPGDAPCWAAPAVGETVSGRRRCCRRWSKAREP